MRFGLSMSLVVLHLALSSSMAGATTRHVPGTYPTISAAAAAASESDTILVAPGVYEETVALNKYLTLVSEAGPEVTIIDGGWAYWTGVVEVLEGLIGHGDGWTVEGFTLRHGTWGVDCAAGMSSLTPVLVRDCIVQDIIDSGVVASQDVVRIEGCIIERCGSAGITISYDYSPAPTEVLWNLIRDNEGPGISVYGEGNFVIDHNTIEGNARGMDVLRTIPDGPGVISNNIITGNSGWGIWLFSPLVPYDCDDVFCNDIWGNGENVAAGSECEEQLIGANGNISSDPIFCDPERDDMTLSEDSPCAGTGYGGTDIGAFGVRCGPQAGMAEEDISWGRIKALYR